MLKMIEAAMLGTAYYCKVKDAKTAKYLWVGQGDDPFKER